MIAKMYSDQIRSSLVNLQEINSLKVNPSFPRDRDAPKLYTQENIEKYVNDIITKVKF